jgi:hypothetical protein
MDVFCQALLTLAACPCSPFGLLGGTDGADRRTVTPILHPGWCGEGAAHPLMGRTPVTPLGFLLSSSSLNHHSRRPSSSTAPHYSSKPPSDSLHLRHRQPLHSQTLRPTPPNPKYTGLLRRLHRWPRCRRLRGAAAATAGSAPPQLSSPSPAAGLPWHLFLLPDTARWDGPYPPRGVRRGVHSTLGGV